MCIVTGLNQDISIKLIKRMKTLFEPHNVLFADFDVFFVAVCTNVSMMRLSTQTQHLSYTLEYELRMLK
jgi:hypothetical protein